MKVEKNSVISIHYTLKNSDGKVIDQSSEGKPLEYLHGHKNIIPGLESALINQSVGDELDVTIEPENAYGTINPSLIQEIPKEHFQGVETLEIGMRFQASTEQGPVPVVISKIEDNRVTVDGNHPLAGETLHFSVKVDAIREAGEEELANGHINSSEGCCGGGEGSQGSCGCS